jgi:phosphoribosylformylglycinamidine synthase
MALAGGLGVDASLRDVPCDDDAARDAALLFSESPTRFLLEVRPEDFDALTGIFGGLPLGRLGEVIGAAGTMPPRLTILGLDASPVIDASVTDLKAAWQRPLRW